MRYFFGSILIAVMSLFSCTSSVEVQDFFMHKEIDWITKTHEKAYDNQQVVHLEFNVMYFNHAKNELQKNTNYFMLNELNRLLMATTQDSLQLKQFKKSAWKSLFKQVDRQFSTFKKSNQPQHTQLLFSSWIDTTMSGYLQLQLKSEYQWMNGQPQATEKWIVIDASNGSQLHVSSIMENDSLLNDLGEKMFRLQQKVRDNEALSDNYWFEDGIFKNPDNFYFTDKGICFVMNAYDVAPYSFGKITYSIPYALLGKDLLIKKEQ